MADSLVLKAAQQSATRADLSPVNQGVKPGNIAPGYWKRIRESSEQSRELNHRLG
jgi:hypothetical protein